MQSKTFSRRALLGALAACGLGGPALAQDDYPNRPIKVIVAYSPGGTTDQVARALVDVMAKTLKATMVIDNVPGAGGAVGAQKAASARPDGYTLLVGANGELVSTGLINPKQGYDTLRDFQPIGVINHQGGMLLASKQSGITRFDQFLDMVRKNPGKYSYGTSGTGSFFHYTGELMKDRAGLNLLHVPYKSVAAITTDMAGGQLDFGFMGAGAAKPLVASGIMVPLAVTSAKRSPLFPQVPAMAEFPKLEGYDLTGWFGLLAPKGISPAIAAKLKTALTEALRDPALQKLYTEQGAHLATESDNLAKFVQDDRARYQQFMKIARIEVGN